LWFNSAQRQLNTLIDPCPQNVRKPLFKSEGCACIAGNHPHLYSAYTPAPSTELNRKNNQEHQQESENMEKVENMGFCCGIY
jgi:hypothetical protein